MRFSERLRLRLEVYRMVSNIMLAQYMSEKTRQWLGLCPKPSEEKK